MSSSRKNGQIGIVEGKIKVVNPEGEGKLAVLYPPDEGVTILINGELVEGAVEVREEDTIEVNKTSLLEEARIDVKVSSDGLSATAAVFPRITGKYHLKDKPMSASLKPEIGKEELSEPVLTVMEAEAELKQKNVVDGIDYVALKNALEKAEGEHVEVARGKPKEEGQNGYVEYLINTEVEAINYEGEEERVDFRERYRYPSVNQDDVIAVIHPPVNGVPGQTVTGNVLPPKPVKPARVRVGEGVYYNEDETEVIAARDGRLFVKGNSIKVANLLVHNGDVDLESGNIRFNGDLTIHGNIMEGMVVETQGDLQVEGNAYGASIAAGGSVSLSKNVIKSQVEGGTYYAFIDQAFPILRRVGEDFSSFLVSLKEVIKGVAGKGQKIDQNKLNKIIHAVLEKSAPDIGEQVKNLEKMLENKEDPRLDSLKSIIRLLSAMIATDLSLNEFKDLEKIDASIKSALDTFEKTLQEKPHFQASYVQNSTINHGGHVTLTGTGGYFSTIKAAGEVNVEGAFRGGSIESGGNVKVKEFICITTAAEAAEKRTIIRIKVPSHATIAFNIVHEDTTIQVGKLVYRFDKELSNVKVSYDPDSGMLKITNF